jgi:hypothetical protein
MQITLNNLSGIKTSIITDETPVIGRDTNKAFLALSRMPSGAFVSPVS